MGVDAVEKFPPVFEHCAGFFNALPETEMIREAAAFYGQMQSRRTIRSFEKKEVPLEVVKQCLLAAGTAPSGANLQPWHFVTVMCQKTKRMIRQAAENVEAEFYRGDAAKEWLDALAPLGTNQHKAFLEEAPCLIAIFSESYRSGPDNTKLSNYYPRESTGIATGILITALHRAGLATLTYTPSPMRFLREVLGVPSNFKPFLLLVVGYPREPVLVPRNTRKSLDKFCRFV